jgi:DNA polymerase I
MSKTLTLRGCIEAERGYILVSLDASQIELRVVGTLSQDPLLLEALKTEDLHMATALQVFGFTEDKEEMALRRYLAKQLNFAILYGATAYKIAEMSDCSVEFAEEIIRKYFDKYKVLEKWIKDKKKEAKDNGYVTNLFGRKRFLPDIRSRDRKLREAAEREAINTIVQGTAVDIFKMIMLYLRKILPVEVRFILQVHDELVLEVPIELLELTINKTRELAVVFTDYPCKLTLGKYYGELVTVEEYYKGENNG